MGDIQGWRWGFQSNDIEAMSGGVWVLYHEWNYETEEISRQLSAAGIPEFPPAPAPSDE